ncbi:MAG: V-type ATP synthase subunit D [Candidatus Omnitrophica bacterium]|nr:V-type ATP synthase subunit D [Candidatus Omnitrophota bacterium]MDD5351654.1 V-type ATP synthase subunit D [Candidatus Omnitrophota bacterium]MDD5550864.1 V-type ATP synthase subunit D [Candidatus Omnitrophota bacterium]
MILQINPNRMELLRLRRRLALARRGHKLLQDKLEEMMRRFLSLLKDIDRAKEDFQKLTQSVLADLLYCRITSSRDNFQEAMGKIDTQMRLAVSTLRIMNVKVPVFNIEQLKIDRHYDFFKTSAQLDLVIASAKGYIQSLLKLAQLLKTLDILSYEIERTRRRVNALEYMLIPSIEETIRYITHKLNEFERGNLVRLMRVKEIVRSH